MMAFCSEHPKWDQNPKFTPLSETTSIPTLFISGVPRRHPGVYNRWGFLLLLGLGCKKHLKIKETRNYYFKTIGYCSRTKVKSSLILRRFYATWPLALTLGLKCYYLWELYHARVPIITYTCDFHKRCPFSHGACLNLKKAKTKTKTIQVHLFLYQSGHVCERVYRWFAVSNALERSKQRI